MKILILLRKLGVGLCFSLLTVLIVCNFRAKAEVQMEKLGQLYPGMSLEEVYKILGPEDFGDKGEDLVTWYLIYNSGWQLLVDEKTRVVEQLIFGSATANDIATLKGIKIGDLESKVISAYDKPSLTLSLTTELMLRNSPFLKYLFYENYNMAIFLKNNDINKEEWRVISITVCTPVGYQSFIAGSPAYARRYITNDLKEKIINVYGHGKKDLEIYDGYILEKIKLMPEDNKIFFAYLDEKIQKNITYEAKKVTAQKYNISQVELENIIKEVEEFINKNYQRFYANPLAFPGKNRGRADF